MAQNDLATSVNKIWDEFLSQIPLGSVVVWGEQLLSSIWPEFNTIKQEVLYFVAYAEASANGQPSAGQTKKNAVMQWVMTQVDKVVPQGFFTGIIEGVLSTLIDGLVTYLNTNMPGWEDKVMQYFPSTTAVTPSSTTK